MENSNRSETTGRDRVSCTGLTREQERVMKENLKESVTRGRWRHVVDQYGGDERARRAKITRSGDTALHVAMYEEEEFWASQMLEILDTCNEQEVLAMTNEMGNTALHYAALMGSYQICMQIARMNPSLVSVRNSDGETPLFLAVLHGHKRAFLFLHHCDPSNYDLCRRIDGDTILHSAVAGDYFDLAFQIIHLYRGLVHSVNKRGSSVLHLLATKPSTFRSGSRLGLLDNIIYSCISVDELKLEAPVQSREDRMPYNHEVPYPAPPNYTTCFDLLTTQRPHNAAEAREDVEGGELDVKALYPIVSKCIEFLRFCFLAVLAIFKQKGWMGIDTIRQTKEKHLWSVQVMRIIVQERASSRSYHEEGRLGTPIITAAKHGVTEIIENVLEFIPEAARDIDADGKNVVLAAVENRQPHVYQLFLRSKYRSEILVRKVDDGGNSAMHLAAKLGESEPWLIPGPALQMQWEIKWFEFVRDSMPKQFFVRYNNDGKTPEDIFTDTHKDLVKRGEEWLKKTSESCSVVATLIATVAFATSTAIPGGLQEKTGTPNLEHHPAFSTFAISSLVALYCSVFSMMMFLSILTSRHREYDFGMILPIKFICGVTTLFVSIASMLVSFCAGHFLATKDKLKYAAFPLYAVASLPVLLFALVQSPLYIKLIWAITTKVPQRSYRAIPLNANDLARF